MAFQEYAILIAFVLISAVVVVWPAAVICRRIGYSPWLGVLAIVPLAQIALLWFIALSPWDAVKAGDHSARPPRQGFLSFFRSLRARIRMIGLPQQP